MDWKLRLGILVAITTLMTMMMGSYVSATDAGLGCQDRWPLCEDSDGNQQFYPDLDNEAMVIEWLHRAVASLLGLLAIAWIIVASRALKVSTGELAIRTRDLRRFTIVTLVLIILQGLLGATVVWVNLAPAVVAFHQGTEWVWLRVKKKKSLIQQHKKRVEWKKRRRNRRAIQRVVTAGVSFPTFVYCCCCPPGAIGRCPSCSPATMLRKKKKRKRKKKKMKLKQKEKQQQEKQQKKKKKWL